MTSRKFFSDLLKYIDKNGQNIMQNYEKGLLTYNEAVNMAIDLYKSHENKTDQNIKAWYTAAFPDDEAGQEIDNNITFEEAYHAMKMGDDFYETIGYVDSIIRERIFTEMSYLFKVSYDHIYNTWLYTA